MYLPGITLACLGLALSTSPAWTQEQPQDAWRFQAVIYAYLPSVGGETTFEDGGGGSDASFDSSAILDNLNFAFMGSFAAEKGRRGMFADVIYLDIGDSESPSRSFTIGAGLPVDASATVHYDLKGWLWTLAGSRRLATAPGYEVNLIGGARLLDIEQAIDWQLTGSVGSVPLPDRAGTRTAGLSNWDAIIGLKGRFLLGEKRRWIVPWHFDIGTGESEFAWQAMAGVGYEFGWGGVTFAWRHIDYEMKSGNLIETLDFDGPGIAVSFRW